MVLQTQYHGDVPDAKLLNIAQNKNAATQWRQGRDSLHEGFSQLSLLQYAGRYFTPLGKVHRSIVTFVSDVFAFQQVINAAVFSSQFCLRVLYNQLHKPDAEVRLVRKGDDLAKGLCHRLLYNLFRLCLTAKNAECDPEQSAFVRAN